MLPRRALLRTTSLALFVPLTGTAGLVTSAAFAQDAPEILMVSRERLLQQVRVARTLRAEEQRMTISLQAAIDRTKVALAEEESEIAGLRGEIPDVDFTVRIEDFDRRMRLARQLTQERAAALQSGFQSARAKVVAAIPAIMERLRRETGASMIADADQMLAADPALDVTDRAVELFDRHGPEPEPPEIDLNLPVSELITPATGPADAPGE